MKDQEQRLYSAENLSGLKGKEEFSLQECERYLNRIWRKKYVVALRSTTSPRVGVTDGRRRRSACASYRLGIPTVTLPKWGRHEYVMLHELAHLVAGLYSNHNPKFATVLLTLVRRELGKESAEKLLAAFALKGVKVINKSGKVVKARCPKSQREWFLLKKQNLNEQKAHFQERKNETAEFKRAIENGEPIKCRNEECSQLMVAEKYIVRINFRKVQIIWEAKCACGRSWGHWRNERYDSDKHDNIEFDKRGYYATMR